MIDVASKGENIELWGNPDAFKDILYIKDLCQMMHKAILSGANGGTYNAGTVNRQRLSSTWISRPQNSENCT